MPPDEQVLVFETSVLEEPGVFHGLKFDIEPYLRRIFAPGVLRFMPRPKAEADPAYKQLIPYVIMTHAGKYLNYVRGKRAGETRLVGNRSIGIGGHINPVDETLFTPDFRHVYQVAACSTTTPTRSGRSTSASCTSGRLTPKTSPAKSR